LRHLFLCLIPLFLLGACATVPKSDVNKAVEAPDFSRPNLYSTYYFLSGSYASFQDPIAAKDQYQKALSHDPGSPQIKKALLRVQMELFGLGDINGDEMRQSLDQARLEQQLDSFELYHALRIYEYLKDAEGVSWALDQLKSSPQDETALFLLYEYQYSHGAAAAPKTIRRILDASKNKDQMAWALAGLHLQKDPKITMQLLERYPNDPNSPTLWLDLMIKQENYSAISERFAAMQYPQHSQIMMVYMDSMRQQKRVDVILPHARMILATKDKNLIAMLSELALYGNDAEVVQSITAFLMGAQPEPQMDSPIAATLLSYALLHEEAELPVEELCRRVTALRPALSIAQSYLYIQVIINGMTESDAFTKLEERTAKVITLPQLAKLFVPNSGGSEQKIQNAADYALYLAENNLCGTEDYDFLIDHAIENYDDGEIVRILRLAVQAYPTRALYLNNLGYFLIKDPARLDEAEQLIQKALDYEPEQASFLDSMAWLLYSKGDFAAAANYITKLKQNMTPEEELHPEVLYHIGMIYLAQGKREAAEECMNAITDPDNAFRLLLDEALSGK